MGATTALMAAAGTGGVLSAVSSVAGGFGEDRRLRAEAQLLERDAQEAIRASKFKARQKRLSAEQQISRGVAITGASGVKVNRGSSLRAREVDAGRTETSVMNIVFSGRFASHRLRQGAANKRQQGKQAKVAGVIGGVTSILQSAAKIAGAKSNMNIMSKLKGSGMDTRVDFSDLQEPGGI